MLIFGLGTLGSGLLLSVSSRRGLLRYWWVVAKLLINLALTSLVVILLHPRLTAAAEHAQLVEAALPQRLDDLRVDLLFPAFVSGGALLAAALLATFKPWGRTPLGRRDTSDARDGPDTRRTAATTPRH
jgi:uncharacterized membrane protein